MSIDLQDFAAGDTNYVAKLNSNNTVLELAIAALQALTSGAAVSGITLTTAYEALFGASVALIGKDSYACSDAGGSPSGNLTVAAGYCYRPSLSAVLSKGTSSTLSFNGQSAATYYVVIDSSGEPTRSDSSTEAVYSVVWTGSAFGAITRVAAVVWGAADWVLAQSSAALGGTYRSLDERLEAAEAAAAGASTAQAPNTVYAGPAGGSPTNDLPTFRALVAADMTADLAAIEVLTSTGFLKRTGSNTWALASAVAASDFGAQDSNVFLAGPSAGSPTTGTPTFRAITQGDLPAQPYDVGGSYAGVPTASLVLARYPFPRTVVFPAGLTNSQGVAGTAATAQTDFDIKKNGSSVGTMRFAAAGTTASFIMASQTSFAAGDILTLVAPASPDATLANIGFALAGTR
jgi:hypothetical protein